MTKKEKWEKIVKEGKVQDALALTDNALIHALLIELIGVLEEIEQNTRP
ncbi:MAG: hypothetical protein ACYTAO_16450 [Planctomycetota bacterium]|jgi:hypothetical protein